MPSMVIQNGLVNKLSCSLLEVLVCQSITFING